MGGKQVSIRNMVLIGFIKVILGSVLITMLSWVSLFMWTLSGIFKKANYFEKQFPTIRQSIINNGFDRKQLPEGYRFVIYDKDNKIEDYNINKKNFKYANKALKKGEYIKNFYIINMGGQKFSRIKIKNKNVIIQYALNATYSSSVLNKCLPNPECIANIMPFIGMILMFYLVSKDISKKINYEFNNLIDVVNKVRDRKLDFYLGSSEIKEINLLNDAFNNMGKELKESLEKQWRMEEQRKEQTSAITHDVKTPLMLIYGHADLLMETKEISSNQKEHIVSIINASEQIERLMNMLLESSRIELKKEVKREKIDTFGFLREIYIQSKELCGFKNINLKFSINKIENLLVISTESKVPKEIFINKMLVERAMINIVRNAIEVTKENHQIEIFVEVKEKRLRFIVHDDGIGFSQKDLKYSTKQFYRGDNSRKRNGHYGLGLYITETVAKLHNGELIIKNHPNGGAVVEFIVISKI